MTSPITPTPTDLDKQLEKILRSEFYVNGHDDCGDSCSRKYYADEAFKRATQAIQAEIVKARIAELESLAIERNAVMCSCKPHIVARIDERVMTIDDRITALKEGLKK